MTAKELFEKVKAHNQLAEELRSEKLFVTFRYYYTDTIYQDTTPLSTYEEFETYACEEFSQRATDEIKSFPSFKPNKKTRLMWNEGTGVHDLAVVFFVY